MKDTRSRRPLATALLLLPAALFLLLWFAAPLGELLRLSFSDPRGALAAYRELVTGDVYRRVFANTLLVSVVVTGISILLGYPIAHVLTRLHGARLHFAFWCVLFPFWVSVLVRTFSWMLLLERNGPVNAALEALGLTSAPLPLLFNNTAVYIGMTHVMLPYAVLPIYASLVRIDRRLLLASDGLGASPWTTFRRVYLPLGMPGVGAAAALVFLLSLGFFITPALLGGISNITVAMLIEHLVNERLVWSLAAAAAFLLLGVTLALLFVAARLVPIGQALSER
ncbi:MAG TPA: ABC transporter permease [Stellaceae bacterium]|nr:ABC transporter permease [Stellaceae bacterium]